VYVSVGRWVGPRKIQAESITRILPPHSNGVGSFRWKGANGPKLIYSAPVRLTIQMDLLVILLRSALPRDVSRYSLFPRTFHRGDEISQLRLYCSLHLGRLIFVHLPTNTLRDLETLTRGYLLPGISRFKDRLDLEIVV
jgi:hypothetical protein